MKYSLLAFLFLMTCELCAQKTFVVKTAEPGAEISKSMWGIFFEDINLAADGGIYAELVKNRSFEFDQPLMGWKEQRRNGSPSSLLVQNRAQTNPQNPRYLTITLYSDTARYGLTNEGFRGMGIKKDNQYDLSVWANVQQGNDIGLKAEFVNEKAAVLGTADLKLNGSGWKKYTVRFNSSESEPKAKLNIWFTGTGKFDIDMISVFPADTWKGRPGGLRNDLVQLLADMKPGFIRFPGGCIVEGRTLENRYQWKKTVGNIEDRELIINRWNTEFAHRSTPDYFQSFGLGFFEYFQLAEDIGAEPLPILNCGMACQFNTGEVVPMDQLDPYIQDALDLIEFANGSPQTKWGKLRADMGHPEPFHLKMLGVGNEQWGEQYIERYKVFAKTLKEKYPDIQLISSVGPFSGGALFDFLSPAMHALKADIVDEHYYAPPEWFLRNARRYDKYDRNGPKVFAGEYAGHVNREIVGEKRNNFGAALAEAAFMTGLERNSDIVRMASYAPLFAHLEGWQWAPDLIWFDNLRSYPTPSYHVQKLFSTNRGTNPVPVLLNGEPVAGQDSCYASAVVDKNKKELIIKIVNAGPVEQVLNLQLDGIKKTTGKASLTILKAQSLEDMNMIDQPDRVKPIESLLDVKKGKITLVAGPESINVVRVKLSF
jgi:alpha-N-arabinofuranosidase